MSLNMHSFSQRLFLLLELLLKIDPNHLNTLQQLPKSIKPFWIFDFAMHKNVNKW